MKIAIDTKEDSLEDIKKVIKMLQHLVGESVFENREEQGELKEGIFNLFDNPPQENSQHSEKKDEFDIDEFIDEKKDEDDEPKVIPY